MVFDFFLVVALKKLSCLISGCCKMSVFTERQKTQKKLGLPSELKQSSENVVPAPRM